MLVRFLGYCTYHADVLKKCRFHALLLPSKGKALARLSSAGDCTPAEFKYGTRRLRGREHTLRLYQKILSKDFIFCPNLSLSAISAINSELVGLPLLLRMV